MRNPADSRHALARGSYAWTLAPALLIAAVLALSVSIPQAAAATRNNDAPVRICHATGASSNPYVLLVVDDGSRPGHRAHDGDIIPAPASGCPRRVDTCETAGGASGLPCQQVPVFPAPLVGLGATMLGAAGALALVSRGRRARDIPDDPDGGSGT